MYYFTSKALQQRKEKWITMEKEIVTALITGVSVASVSIVGAIMQFMTTKLKYREEITRKEKEYELQLKRARYNIKKDSVKTWKKDFFDMLMDLIMETDIEITKQPDQRKIVMLVQKLQFLLRPSIKQEEDLMRCLTGIAHYFSKDFSKAIGDTGYFGLHAKLTELGREIYYKQDEKL
jgi:hypothetical protein